MLKKEDGQPVCCELRRKKEEKMLYNRLGIIFGYVGIHILLAASIYPTCKVVFAQEVCQPGTLLEPYSGVCAPIKDVRIQMRGDGLQGLRTQMVPNLMQLRTQFAKRLGVEAEQIQTPGGIGAGTQYLRGSLQALEHGELHTKMFVHPDGIQPSNLELDWLFTTATNRVEKCVEVVGIYFRDGPGSLGVFDWSCSDDYPCEDGQTGPEWLWTKDFSELPCNMVYIKDQGDHIEKIVHYANLSVKIDNGDPPLWENAIYLWNYCEQSWDFVYGHSYRKHQIDCSQFDNSCAWWGPILETFIDAEDPYPEIREVGFEDSLLLHDGQWSWLTPEETAFADPNSPWQLFHLDPNRGYGAGNYAIEVIDGDFNNDGDIDGSNLAVFVAAYGSAAGEPKYRSDANFNADGFIDHNDLTFFASVFGQIYLQTNL
jgi:hypothetical protein